MPTQQEIVILKLQAENDKLVKTVNQTERKLKRLEDRAKKTKKTFKTVFSGISGSLAGGLAALGFGAAIKAQLDFADSLSKTSTKLGISTEALSQYEYVAQRANVPFRDLEMGLQRMSRRVAEAAQGTGEGKAALQELGLSAKALSKIAPDQQFEAIADAMLKVTNHADKIRLSFKLFDSGGVKFLQMMENGATGIRKLRDEANSLGKTITKSVAEDAAKANDVLTKFNASFDALFLRITSKVSPAIQELGLFFDNLRESMRDDTDFEKRSDALRRQKEIAEEIAAIDKTRGDWQSKLQVQMLKLHQVQAELAELDKKRDLSLKEAADAQKKVTNETEKTGNAISDIWNQAIENAGMKMESLADKVVGIRDKIQSAGDIKLKDNASSLNYLRMSAESKFRKGDEKGGIADLNKAAEMISRMQEAGKSTSSYLVTQLDLIQKLSEQSTMLADNKLPKIQPQIEWGDKDLTADINEQLSKVKPDPVIVPIKYATPDGYSDGSKVSDLFKQTEKSGSKQ